MQNGAFDQKVKEIEGKLFQEGLDSLTDRDLQLLMLHSQNKELQELVGMKDIMRSPFWKLWTFRELLTAGTFLLFLLGTINFEQLMRFISTIASASGVK